MDFRQFLSDTLGCCSYLVASERRFNHLARFGRAEFVSTLAASIPPRLPDPQSDQAARPGAGGRLTP